jgi:dihydrofolate reductase
MGKVVGGMTISLDGFVNDRNRDVSRLYSDFAAFVNSQVVQEAIKTTGAVVMGRHAYDMGEGDFTGYEFQVPIFVLTHHVPENAAKGENENLKLNFVTDGIESAIEKAKAAAGDKDVTVVGGANTIQQLIKARLLDEIQVDIVPILLGEGLRLFDHLGTEYIELERTRVIETPGFTHLRFRIVK